MILIVNTKLNLAEISLKLLKLYKNSQISEKNCKNFKFLEKKAKISKFLEKNCRNSKFLEELQKSLGFD